MTNKSRVAGRTRVRTVRTLEKGRAVFLKALGETASVKAACALSKLPRRTVYDWRASVARFRAQWDQAVELGTDALEDEAIRRAHAGVDRPVYQSGEKVGTVREYSDTLLIFMLKARRPDRFKERAQIDHKHDLISQFMDQVSGRSRGLPGKDQPAGS